MKIKGSPFLFFILSVCFSQALALDLGYKSDIPADNKPSEEYLKKRNQLDHKDWDMEKLASDNTLAEKQENERQEYQNRFKYKQQHSESIYDWDKKRWITSSHMNSTHTMQNFKKHKQHRCYRETRQKLEKEKGNGYSYADISDACGFY
ncbi:hypothetical protein [Xenorhabdus koppenhoeferi]|uniref:Uncharacterized protein n=1 Tax=Xenorhabdus koppenhoeferi TaxID=351659 RepID=A0A1I7EX07_9GAMM|nr:hypothetical protein [Xenorhabdus koppenhoeferi]SFU28451.1 hypothetical protein SAMN05421784_10245 [Xenorhabdus koppenhoeferi]